jgi:hypothetical protein
LLVRGRKTGIRQKNIEVRDLPHKKQQQQQNKIKKTKKKEQRTRE